VGTAWTDFLSRLPRNEILQLNVHDKRLLLPRLDPGLDGFRITHLSDLHLTGQLSCSFYREVVQIANEWPSDFVAITGDIVEKVACLDWLPETLGQLQARYGVFFVLGNHEKRIQDEQRVRTALTGVGLIDLGSSWQLGFHARRPFVVAGNELPWFGPAANLQKCPHQVDGFRPLRIVLAHSPDQLPWARRNDCDLLLAGHTHGGQVRLPLVGPILSPSRRGTRFASGTYYYPPTLMHVSRGIAGTRPLRWNCPPELARLVLCSEKVAGHTQSDEGRVGEIQFAALEAAATGE
jgi:predicted MPP superfamily phosphohydrolase